MPAGGAPQGRSIGDRFGAAVDLAQEATSSQGSAMSSSNARVSRDMNEVPLDARPHPRLDSVLCQHVHSPAEQRFEKQRQTN